MEPGRDDGAYADEQRVHAKAQAIFKTIEAIVVLEEERGGRDIGEESEEATHDGERAEGEPLIAEDAEEIGVRRGQRLTAAALSRQRLAEAETAEGEDDAERHEQAEDALPIDEVRQHAAQHRCKHGHNTIDCPEDGEEIGELPTLIHIGSDALRQHHAGRDLADPTADWRIEVSIHAPTRGATLGVVGHFPHFEVSIHAPTRGATQPWPESISPYRGFNPRAHAGRDP